MQMRVSSTAVGYVPETREVSSERGKVHKGFMGGVRGKWPEARETGDERKLPMADAIRG